MLCYMMIIYIGMILGKRWTQVNKCCIVSYNVRFYCVIGNSDSFMYIS